MSPGMGRSSPVGPSHVQPAMVPSSAKAPALPDPAQTKSPEQSLPSKDPETPVPSVSMASYCSLFRYATCRQAALTLLGAVLGFLNGAAMPAFALLFGKYTNRVGCYWLFRCVVFINPSVLRKGSSRMPQHSHLTYLRCTGQLIDTLNGNQDTQLDDAREVSLWCVGAGFAQAASDHLRMHLLPMRHHTLPHSVIAGLPSWCVAVIGNHISVQAA